VKVDAESQIVNSDLSVDTLDTHAIDALPVALCVTDRDGGILRFNQRAIELWGAPPLRRMCSAAPLRR
jgi:PAS domain-containing protein